MTTDPNPDPPPLVEEIQQFKQSCCLSISLCNERLRRKWAGVPAYDTDAHHFEPNNYGVNLYTLVESQGYRPYMEDRYISKPIRNGQSCLFAVLDGHGLEGEGHIIADYASKHLHKIVEKHLDSIDSIESTHVSSDDVQGDGQFFREKLDGALTEMDTVLRQLLPNASENNGTTVTATLVDVEYLTFANLGDSRGVLINKDYTIDFVTLDHKPTVELEETRVVRAGGFVDDFRVNGDLAVSRTLGDVTYKPSNAPRRLCPISNEPDVTRIKRLDKHRCIILGSDGVWDGLASIEVVDILKEFSLLDGGVDKETLKTNLDAAYKKIMREITISRLSSDNITLLIIILDDNLEKLRAKLAADNANNPKETKGGDEEDPKKGQDQVDIVQSHKIVKDQADEVTSPIGIEEKGIPDKETPGSGMTGSLKAESDEKVETSSSGVELELT